MATGFVYSTSERVRRVDEIISLFATVRSSLVDAVIYETEHLARFDGNTGANPLSGALALIAKSASQLSKTTIQNLLTELNINITLFQGVFTVNSMGIDITAFDLDVDDGSSKATITRVGSGDPKFLTSFAAGDQRTLSNSEDAVNNGTFTVDAATTDTVITLDAVISGGVDNANDKSMVITLIKKA